MSLQTIALLIIGAAITLGIAASAPLALNKIRTHQTEGKLVRILQALAEAHAHGDLKSSDPSIPLAPRVRTLADLHQRHLLRQECTEHYPPGTPRFYGTCPLNQNGLRAILLTDRPTPGTTDQYAYGGLCEGTAHRDGLQGSAWCRAIGLRITGPQEDKTTASRVVTGTALKQILGRAYPRFGRDRCATGAVPSDWNCNEITLDDDPNSEGDFVINITFYDRANPAAPVTNCPGTLSAARRLYPDTNSPC